MVLPCAPGGGRVGASGGTFEWGGTRGLGWRAPTVPVDSPWDRPPPPRAPRRGRAAAPRVRQRPSPPGKFRQAARQESRQRPHADRSPSRGGCRQARLEPARAVLLLHRPRPGGKAASRPAPVPRRAAAPRVPPAGDRSRSSGPRVTLLFTDAKQTRFLAGALAVGSQIRSWIPKWVTTTNAASLLFEPAGASPPRVVTKPGPNATKNP